MKYTIEPAYLVRNELVRLILQAGNDPINKWFFTDGAFSPDSQIEHTPNTWQHENFVVIANNQILAYFLKHFGVSPWILFQALELYFLIKINQLVLFGLFLIILNICL